MADEKPELVKTDPFINVSDLNLDALKDNKEVQNLLMEVKKLKDEAKGKETEINGLTEKAKQFDDLNKKEHEDKVTKFKELVKDSELFKDEDIDSMDDAQIDKMTEVLESQKPNDKAKPTPVTKKAGKTEEFDATKYTQMRRNTVEKPVYDDAGKLIGWKSESDEYLGM